MSNSPNFVIPAEQIIAKAMICEVEGPVVVTSTDCEGRWRSSPGRRNKTNERQKTLSSSEPAPLKPKAGLSGPPVPSCQIPAYQA
jgi:hypothetical protein